MRVCMYVNVCVCLCVTEIYDLCRIPQLQLYSLNEPDQDMELVVRNIININV